MKLVKQSTQNSVNNKILIKNLNSRFDLKGEKFVPAISGTHHNVVISNSFVVRYRNTKQEILKREAKFLKNLHHPLIPSVLWSGKVEGYDVMIENRLQGETLDIAWRNLTTEHKNSIVVGLAKFLEFLQTQQKNHFYSVQTGLKYDNFFESLVQNIVKMEKVIKKNNYALPLLMSLTTIINDKKSQKYFKNEKSILVHGDLIIHNILVQNGKLSGVLDWELARFGNTSYDLYRLLYYKECAQAYEIQGEDEIYEAEYMKKFFTKILDNNLIENITLFNRQYIVARAVFILNALYWSVNSDAPEKNVNELNILWNNKNGGITRR